MIRRLFWPVLTLLVLMVAVAPVAADGGEVTLSTLPGSDRLPAVAYNSFAQEFLVVWNHADDIYGQRYNWRGVPLGENFIVGTSNALQSKPAVAYALGSDAYMVVWEEHLTKAYDLYGQLVDSNGQLLDNPDTPEDETDPAVYFAVCEDDGDQRYPDIEYDGTNFLVAWQDGRSGAEGIYGRFFRAEGTALSQTHPIVSGGSQLRLHPALAYNAIAGEYLVVYEYGESTQADIYGRRMAPDGTMPGEEYAIASQINFQYSPDLAAAAWGAYVVVWEDARNGGEPDIYGRVVLAGADSSFDGESFPLCMAAGDQFYPAIARSPSTGQFLVAWEDERADLSSGSDIYAQRLLQDANLVGTNLPLCAVVGDQSFTAVAAGQSPDLYFVAWQDERAGPSDIYAQRVSWTGSLLWTHLAVSTQPGAQSWPAVAYNDQEDQFLVAWEDDASGDGAIYGQRLSGAGLPLEEPWAIEADGRDNRYPEVIYNSVRNLYLVLWADTDNDVIEGRIVYPAGTATTYFMVPESDDGIAPRAAYDAGSDHFLLVWAANGEIWSYLMCGNGLPCWGSATRLQGGAVSLSEPAVAFDAEHGRFLVAWQDMPAGDNTVSGVLADADGQPLSESFLIGGGGDSFAQAGIRLAYNPDGDEYLVVYSAYLDANNSQIRGQRVGWSGALNGGEIAVAAPIADVFQLSPGLAYLPSVQRYGVIWTDDRDGSTDYDIYGRWLEAEGTPVGQERPAFRYYGAQDAPALAYHPAGDRAIIVWADRRGGGHDIYARPGPIDVTPPEARFLTNPSVGTAGTTFAFSAWPSSDDLTPPEALQVRWDWTSDGTWDTDLSLDKVVSQTVWLPGTYTITLEVWDMAWLTGTAAHTITVLAPTANTSPTAALTVSPGLGLAGSEFLFDASGSSDAETPTELWVRWDWDADGEWDTWFRQDLTATRVFTWAGLHTVYAEVRDGEGLTDNVAGSLLVLPTTAISLAVTPAEVVVVPHERVQFRATAWDGYGNPMNNPPVTWTVVDAAAGTISSTGVLTAGTAAGAFPGAVVAELNTLSASASVTVLYPYRIYLPLVFRAVVQGVP